MEYSSEKRGTTGKEHERTADQKRQDAACF
jgi:hypothetical protein